MLCNQQLTTSTSNQDSQDQKNICFNQKEIHMQQVYVTLETYNVDCTQMYIVQDCLLPLPPMT